MPSEAQKTQTPYLEKLKIGLKVDNFTFGHIRLGYIEYMIAPQFLFNKGFGLHGLSI